MSWDIPFVGLLAWAWMNWFWDPTRFSKRRERYIAASNLTAYRRTGEFDRWVG